MGCFGRGTRTRTLATSKLDALVYVSWWTWFAALIRPLIDSRVRWRLQTSATTNVQLMTSIAPNNLPNHRLPLIGYQIKFLNPKPSFCKTGHAVSQHAELLALRANDKTSRISLLGWRPFHPVMMQHKMFRGMSLPR